MEHRDLLVFTSFTEKCCKIIQQLLTVISAISHSGYCLLACLLLKNSRFCTRSVFMCLVQTSEQTGKISVHKSKFLVFTTHTA